jgi:hypothetical protein
LYDRIKPIDWVTGAVNLLRSWDKSCDEDLVPLLSS